MVKYYNLFFCVAIIFDCTQAYRIDSGSTSIPNTTTTTRIIVSDSRHYLWETLQNLNDNIIKQAFVPNYLSNLDQYLVASIKSHKNDNISEQCYTALRRSLYALIHERQSWSVKMYNAWGHFPPAGMMSGVLTDFGDYDQCLDVASTAAATSAATTGNDYDHNEEKIDSQYCLLNIQLPMPRPMPVHHNFFHQTPNLLPPPTSTLNKNGTFVEDLAQQSSVFYYADLQLGICLPTQCTGNDVEFFTQKHLPQIGLALKKFHCQTLKPPLTWTNLNTVQIFAIIYIIVIVTISSIALVYDRILNDNECKFSNEPFIGKVLRWFSPLRNMRKVLFTGSMEDELSCVHGIRFLTICWIIIGHTLEWNNLNIFRDVFQIKYRLSSILLQPLFKGHYSVDTFFYISGLLSAYIGLQFTKGQYRYFSFSKFFFFRFVRLLPQLLVFLLLTSLLPPLFDGPIWRESMTKLEERCYQNWWQNLLFIQNLIDIQNICARHTWYLAADMQLHWLSLIPMILLLRNRSIGVRTIIALIIVCMSITSITIFVQNLPPGAVVTTKNDFQNDYDTPSGYIELFHKPWNHANVFFIGFLFGVYLYESAQNAVKRVKYSRITKYLLWIVTLVAYLITIYDTFPWLYGQPYNRWLSAFLYPLNGLIWASMLTLLMWLCITNNGTIVGRFLSWSVFRPFSRITYSVYLCHVWILYVALGTRRNLIDIQLHSVMLFCTAIIVMSMLIGFIFTVIVEAPVIHFLEHLKSILMKRFIVHECTMADAAEAATAAGTTTTTTTMMAVIGSSSSIVMNCDNENDAKHDHDHHQDLNLENVEENDGNDDEQRKFKTTTTATTTLTSNTITKAQAYRNFDLLTTSTTTSTTTTAAASSSSISNNISTYVDLMMMIMMMMRKNKNKNKNNVNDDENCKNTKIQSEHDQSSSMVIIMSKLDEDDKNDDDNGGGGGGGGVAIIGGNGVCSGHGGGEEHENVHKNSDLTCLQYHPHPPHNPNSTFKYLYSIISGKKNF